MKYCDHSLPEMFQRRPGTFQRFCEKLMRLTWDVKWEALSSKY